MEESWQILAPEEVEMVGRETFESRVHQKTPWEVVGRNAAIRSTMGTCERCCSKAVDYEKTWQDQGEGALGLPLRRLQLAQSNLMTCAVFFSTERNHFLTALQGILTVMYLRNSIDVLETPTRVANSNGMFENGSFQN